MAMLNLATLTKHLLKSGCCFMIKKNKLDVLALMETRLNSRISDELVAIFDKLVAKKGIVVINFQTMIKTQKLYENQ